MEASEDRPRVRLETARLVLRELDSQCAVDAAFMLALLNDPGFVRGIADVGVRDVAGAAAYIARACEPFFAQYGFGMFGVEERATGELVGLMGLLKRDALDAPDLGFAFLEGACRKGFATEAGRAALRDARTRCGLERVVAITDADNLASQACLGKLGFSHQGVVRLTEGGPELMLFGATLVPCSP